MSKQPARHIVFDIETVPDPDVPFEIKPKMRVRDAQLASLPAHLEIYDARPFAPPACHKVVVVGFALFENYVPTLIKTADGGSDEEVLLDRFLSYVFSHKSTLVSWNGRGFDMPVMLTRSLKYGATLPYWFNSRDTRYRYSDRAHIDVKDQIAKFGAAPSCSLEQVSRMLGLPGKPTEDDGSANRPWRIERLVREGKLDHVKRYCLTDVAQLAVIWLRWELLRGTITLEAYHASVTKLGALSAGLLPRTFKVDWNLVSLARKLPVMEDDEPRANSPEDLGFVKRT
jgi:predicted PolB exonuclease-like 3'-5' exonuclease